jgi:hypothetical protein
MNNIPVNEDFEIRACRVWESGANGKLLGWQAMLYKTTPGYSTAGRFPNCGRGIVFGVLRGDPVYPSPEVALNAWRNATPAPHTWEDVERIATHKEVTP